MPIQQKLTPTVLLFSDFAGDCPTSKRLAKLVGENRLSLERPVVLKGFYCYGNAYLSLKIFLQYSHNSYNFFLSN